MRTLALLALLAPPAAAAPFHVPLHAPPRPAPEKGASFLLGAGYGGAAAAGLSIDGPMGAWEAAGRLSERWTGHVHSEGMAFSGVLDASGAARRKTGGLIGTLEADAARHDGPWRLYGGAQVNLSVLDLAGPAIVVLPDGRLRLEPDTAFSIVLGVPVGAAWRGDWGEWRPEAALYALLSPGGGTFFSYALTGTPLTDKTRGVDPFAAFGTRLRLERPDWRVGLEAGASLSTSSGNNEAVTTGYGALTVRVL